jgi:hypothetical protein
MANNLGKLLEALEIPQIKLAEYLEITPQALNSIIQSENTKKYNHQIAEFLGFEEEGLNKFLLLKELKPSQILKIKMHYIAKYDKEKRADKTLIPTINKIEEQIYLEEMIENVRDILEDDIKNEKMDTWQIDTWLIDSIVSTINKKDFKYGIIEYNIIKDFLLMLDKVSKTKADFKLDAYQSILSFIKGISIPEKDINQYIIDLRQINDNDTE